MQNKRTSLHSTFSVNGEFVSEDTRFLPVVIDLMHTGLNLNASYFDKEVVNACIDTVKNTPILGFVEYNGIDGEADFEGHEYVLRKTNNGIEEFYKGNCYGVIPESCNPRWVIKVCDDGVEREFLRVDGLLWEKFTDAANIVRRDIGKSESMEIDIASIEGYDDENGIFHFLRFKFDGACILGDHVTPAMTGANVRINDGFNFSMNDVTDNIRSELNNKLELFNTTFALLVNDKSNQGGVVNMPDTELEQVVEEQSVETEQQPMEVEQELAEQVQAEPEAVEPEGTEGEIVESEFSDAEPMVTDIETNYEKIKADYEEVLAAFNQLKSDYESMKAEYDEIRPKYDEYVRADAQRIADEVNQQKDEKFAEYEDILVDNPEFAALKEKKNEMSVDEIEKECAVMFVRANRLKFSVDKLKTSVTLGVINDSDEYEVPEGYVHTKYGNVKRGR